jgi:uncharacterized protein YjiS (DUF1127 family)
MDFSNSFRPEPEIQIDSYDGSAVEAPPKAPPVPRLGLFARIARIAARMMEQNEYRRTVSALSRLDERTLKDIGINRMEIKYRARQSVRGGRR